MDNREEFLARITEFEKKFEGQDVPRPEHWSGFRVKPRRVEFWYGREFRLHERVCFDLVDGSWQESLLYP
jgi:pyridoxamine 5'-phosphate oxidase